ncbi:MAG TPA: fluoride efflux transporter CrcB [Candidatus Limnocylindria bacterium]|nr:fluoride efflux transporter CrcB [Candidatus Limnocylindria bacterium]
MTLLLIGVGGFFGAIARYLVDGWVSEAVRGSFPWGTLVVNASGSLLLGLLFALAVERASLPADLRGPLGIGFLGAYTTFSTYMLESLRLVEDGALAFGVVNVLGSVAVGLVAMGAGLAIGRAL